MSCCGTSAFRLGAFSGWRAGQKMGEAPVPDCPVPIRTAGVLPREARPPLFSGRWYYSGFQAEQLCVHLSNMEGGRQFSVEYDYLTQVFPNSRSKCCISA